MNRQPILALGALLAGTSVAIGAFAAHGLKAILSPQALAWVDTGAQYQMYHGLAILALGLTLLSKGSVRQLTHVAWCFALSTLVFSGSLYLMAATGWTKLGMITPLGGVGFLFGWGWLVKLAVSGSLNPHQ